VTAHAPLEQLTIARELEGGTFVFSDGTTLWIVDTERHRFQHHDANVDLERVLRFGLWQSYIFAKWEPPRTLVLRPTRGRFTIRCLGLLPVGRPILPVAARTSVADGDVSQTTR
jgi:hypothetical protein